MSLVFSQKDMKNKKKSASPFQSGEIIILGRVYNLEKL